MRCKVCGAYNEDYLEFCENCAAPLEPEAATNGPTGFSSASGNDQGEPSAWGFVRSPNWPKPDFDANTVSEQDIPEAYLNRFEPRPVGAAQESVEPTEDKHFKQEQNQPLEEMPVPRFNAADPSPLRRNAPVCGPVVESIPEDEPALPAVRKELKKPQRAESFSDYGYAGKRKSRKFRSSRNPVVFYAAAGVLVLLIVVFAIALLTKGSGPIFGGIFSKSNITKQATITPDTSDPTNKRYFITVYAKTGSRLRFTAGSLVKDGDDLIITDGKKSMIVDAEIFMPTEPVDSASLNIYPDIVVIGKDGTEEKVEFVEPIVIEVPSIGLTLTSPASPFETVSPDITISGTVDDNTASVFVGDNQFTVDETGGFSGTYSLSAEGQNTITVEARKNGYQIARQTITANYTAPTATNGGNGGTAQPVSAVTGTPSFDFADDQSRRTTEATLTVKGTAQSGAALSVTGVELSNPVTVNSDGTFSFTVKMDKVGLYTATVSSNLNGSVGTRTIYLERSHADKNAYIEGVHAFDYKYLTDAPFHEKAYELVGKVAEVIQTSPFVIAKITTPDGDVLFYYYSGIASVEVGDGKTYEIYGDPNGKDANGLPILYAWYIFKR